MLTDKKSWCVVAYKECLATGLIGYFHLDEHKVFTHFLNLSSLSVLLGYKELSASNNSTCESFA